MTLHKVDFSLPLWRYLYQPVYQRVLDYALAQGETEESIVQRFILLHAKDPSIHLIVDMDENSPSTIKSHCLIQVFSSSVAVILQLKADKPNPSFTKEVFDYVESLAVNKTVYTVAEKGYKALCKKYNLRVTNVVLERIYADRN